MVDWKCQKLRGKIHVKHGFPFKSEFFTDQGMFVVLTPGNFYEEGGFKRNSEKDKCYSETFPDEYLLGQGDIVVAMTEQSVGLLGSMAKVPESNKFLHNQRLGLVTAQEPSIDLDFIYHLFKTGYVRKQIQLTSTGSKVKHTAPERLYDLAVLLPPPEDQSKIAAVLSALDAKIELNNRINTELEAMAKTLYDYWFVQFDFPDAHGRPYKTSGGKMVYNETLKREIPEGWRAETLVKFGGFKNGINYDPSVGGDSVARIVNVRDISSSSYFIRNQQLDELRLPHEEVQKYLVQESSILIARSSLPCATRLIADYSDNTIYCGFIICFNVADLAQKNALFFHLKNIEQAMLNQSGGTIMKNVSQETLKSVCVATPPTDDLFEQFNRFADIWLKKINILEEQTQQLTELRDWLLPMLMNGQVQVA